MGNAVIDMNEREGVVLPMRLKIGLFSTASIDNIDVSTKSSTSFTSLHGTAGSINQHVSNGNEGEAKSIPESLPNDHKLKKLPDWYTEIPPAYMPSDTSIPKSKKPGFIPAVSDVDMLKDKLWLEDPDCPSWAVFHARKFESSSGNPDLSAMLPIWRDDSKLPATTSSKCLHASNRIPESSPDFRYWI